MHRAHSKCPRPERKNLGFADQDRRASLFQHVRLPDQGDPRSQIPSIHGRIGCSNDVPALRLLPVLVFVISTNNQCVPQNGGLSEECSETSNANRQTAENSEPTGWLVEFVQPLALACTAGQD